MDIVFMGILFYFLLHETNQDNCKYKSINTFIICAIMIVLQKNKQQCGNKLYTPLRNNLLCQLFRGHIQQCISAMMKVWHPWQLKRQNTGEGFWSYQLNSTANPAHLPRKWAKLAVLFSWQLQNGPQDFDFFNCHGRRLFI